MDVPKARRHLRLLRWISWAVLCGEIAVMAGFARFLLESREHHTTLLAALALILFLLHVVPALAARFGGKGLQRVSKTGDHWQIGRYSEMQVRSLAEEVAATLPPWLDRQDIRIADRRGTGGWTLLSWLWPGWPRRTAIWVTAGALHYLDPDELKALLLHEAGHHAGTNRHVVPGSWLLGDAALFCLVSWGGSELFFGTGAIVGAFVAARSILVALTARPLMKAFRTTEHLCDLYAAERVGADAMVNVLLKSGEEEELAEVIVVRAARELLHATTVAVDDLELAFEEVRPPGRIFHDSLLRHASEVVRKVTADLRDGSRPPSVGHNQELDDFVSHRRFARRRRIKWRSFDLDADGRLSGAEIRTLCQALREHPDHVLFRCESERTPSSHPSFRERVLLIESTCMGAERCRHGLDHIHEREGGAPPAGTWQRQAYRTLRWATIRTAAELLVGLLTATVMLMVLPSLRPHLLAESAVPFFRAHGGLGSLLLYPLRIVLAAARDAQLQPGILLALTAGAGFVGLGWWGLSGWRRVARKEPSTQATMERTRLTIFVAIAAVLLVSNLWLAFLLPEQCPQRFSVLVKTHYELTNGMPGLSSSTVVDGHRTTVVGVSTVATRRQIKGGGGDVLFTLVLLSSLSLSILWLAARPLWVERVGTGSPTSRRWICWTALAVQAALGAGIAAILGHQPLAVPLYVDAGVPVQAWDPPLLSVSEMLPFSTRAAFWLALFVVSWATVCFLCEAVKALVSRALQRPTDAMLPRLLVAASACLVAVEAAVALGAPIAGMPRLIVAAGCWDPRPSWSAPVLGGDLWFLALASGTLALAVVALLDTTGYLLSRLLLRRRPVPRSEAIALQEDP